MYHLPTTDPFVGPGELVLILDEGMEGRGKERDSGGRGTRGEGGGEKREREGEEREEKWGERERGREKGAEWEREWEGDREKGRMLTSFSGVQFFFASSYGLSQSKSSEYWQDHFLLIFL